MSCRSNMLSCRPHERQHLLQQLISALKPLLAIMDLSFHHILRRDYNQYICQTLHRRSLLFLLGDGGGARGHFVGGGVARGQKGHLEFQPSRKRTTLRSRRMHHTDPAWLTQCWAWGFAFAAHRMSWTSPPIPAIVVIHTSSHCNLPLPGGRHHHHATETKLVCIISPIVRNMCREILSSAFQQHSWVPPFGLRDTKKAPSNRCHNLLGPRLAQWTLSRIKPLFSDGVCVIQGRLAEGTLSRIELHSPEGKVSRIQPQFSQKVCGRLAEGTLSRIQQHFPEGTLSRIQQHFPEGTQQNSTPCFSADVW